MTDDLKTAIADEILRRLALPFGADPTTAHVTADGPFAGLTLYFGEQFILAAPDLPALAEAAVNKSQAGKPVRATWSNPASATNGAKGGRPRATVCTCGRDPHRSGCALYRSQYRAAAKKVVK